MADLLACRRLRKQSHGVLLQVSADCSTWLNLIVRACTRTLPVRPGQLFTAMLSGMDLHAAPVTQILITNAFAMAGPAGHNSNHSTAA